MTRTGGGASPDVVPGRQIPSLCHWNFALVTVRSGKFQHSTVTVQFYFSTGVRVWPAVNRLMKSLSEKLTALLSPSSGDRPVKHCLMLTR